MKFLRKLKDNLFFIFTLFLLVFIPLYPKIPAIGITHTWVYIRLEDFIIAGVYIIFGIFFLLKKVKIKTPLTFPIFLFWGVGLVSTIYAVIFIFPHLLNVFPKLAYLNYLRRIEYLGLFFVAYASVKDKKQIKYVAWTLTVTLIAVILYGFGQRFLHFPAYLTGNEQFAKGIPLILSAKDRITSTFAGHYDLAAWLVMLIPIMGAFAISFKKWYLKIIFITSGFFGVVLLLMTQSRVSYMAYLIGLSFLLVLMKQKKYIIPIIILSLLLLHSFDGISQRFLRTVSTVNLVIDARTGKPVGIVSSTDNTGKAAIVDKQATGEELPQGTGYINLPGGNSQKTQTNISYTRTRISAGKESSVVTNLEGQFIVKKALAYDVSFTTRLQGTWPRAIDAFIRNPLTGSGYSSISLAADNNYLRILGEVGILGLLSYTSIFLFYGIFITKLAAQITSKKVKSFIFGVSAALVGVALNATLIDVFEASKVAYVMWMFIGLSVGFASLYQKEKVDYIKALKKVLSSVWAVAFYLFLTTSAVFAMIIRNYFVGDDFTWLRWVADCKKVLLPNGSYDCQPLAKTLLTFFTQANGFFYRPGTKIYFYFMYSFFWLYNGFYHAFSILAHFFVALLVYILVYKIIKSKLFSFISALFFILFAVHFESVFWIASTGHLIAAFCVLLSLVTYIYWRDDIRKWYLFVISLLAALFSVMFHEFGIVTPLLIIAYDLAFHFSKKELKNIKKGIKYIPFLLIIPTYLFVRFAAHSHWMNGDYNYNLAKLPQNAIGNTIGYIGMILFGPSFQNIQETLRQTAKGNFLLVITGIIISILIFALFLMLTRKFHKKYAYKITLFTILFFFINLLPFLGLGNIAPRYAYVPSVAVALLLGYVLMLIFKVICKYSRFAAYFVIILFVLLYSLLNIYNLVQINKDWYRAGTITKNLMSGFNKYFNVAKSTPANPVFYFVDVPIRTGDAWIFPVGLKDALWFTFQNENLSVNVSKSLDSAFQSADGSSSARVFQFGKDGSVEEIDKTIKNIVIPNGK